MAFDVPTTRGAYTSLSDGWIYLNGGQRAQIPERVISALGTSFRGSAKSLPGETGEGAHARTRQVGASAAEMYNQSARRAFADITGGPVAGVVLGSSKEVLIRQFLQAMSRRISLGTNLVVARTGAQYMNLPFRQAADMYGANIRTAEADLTTGALPEWQYAELVDSHTRLVVVPAADPYAGTIAPVAEIARIVHAQSPAWVFVDATDLAPYRVVDMHELGADIVLVDATSWGGPEVAAMVFKNPAMFAQMTSLSFNPHATGIKRLEVSPVAPALLGGVGESVRHVADLDRAARGSRRHRIEAVMPQVASYLSRLSEQLIDSLGSLPRVYIVGVDSEGVDELETSHLDRIPHVSFLVDDVPASTVVNRLLANGLVTSAVDSYESPLLEAMGVDETNGAVTVGLQPFNTPHDVDQLVRAVASLG